MESLREELIKDLNLDKNHSCLQCIIDDCYPNQCEWDDGNGFIYDELHHRERFLMIITK